jgi:hypothetical protein
MGFDLSQYQPVEDRIREFWQRYPSGRITTTLLSHEDGAYIVQAHVYRGDELRDTPAFATGLARDSYDGLPPNMRGSALEIAETSAVGRALANAGFAPKGQRPSREEMHKASAVAHAAEPPVPPAAAEPAVGAVAAAAGGEPSESVTHGEGVTGSGTLADLLEAVGGSEVKAINAVNKAVGGGYRKSDLESLSPDEWAAGLAAATMGADR